MQTAADVMVDALVVTPETPVRALAEQLAQTGADGACVVADGRLVGVATTMDLIFRETSIHIPTAFILLDAVITLPGQQARMERELERIAAATVEELMTRDPVTVSATSTVQECADKMVRKHLSLLPVVDAQGALLGVVTKTAMVRASGILSQRHHTQE